MSNSGDAVVDAGARVRCGSRAGETPEHVALARTTNGDDSGHVAYGNVKAIMITGYDFAPSPSPLERATDGIAIGASAPGPRAAFTITKNYLVVTVVGVDLVAGVPGMPITFPL